MLRASAIALMLTAAPASACQMSTLFELEYLSESIRHYTIKTTTRKIKDGSICINMQAGVAVRGSQQLGAENFAIWVDCTPCADAQADELAYKIKIEVMRQNAMKMMADVVK